VVWVSGHERDEALEQQDGAGREAVPLDGIGQPFGVSDESVPLTVIYAILTERTPYHERGADDLARQGPPRAARRSDVP
jgi:hypothetical protein